MGPRGPVRSAAACPGKGLCLAQSSRALAGGLRELTRGHCRDGYARQWSGIGPREWRPKIERPRIQIVGFGPKVFDKGIEKHIIERVSVRIYSPAKTIVDLFRHGQRQKVFYGSQTGLIEALQGMKEALRQRKATPAEIARFAVEAGIWEKVVQPRLEALTVDA